MKYISTSQAAKLWNVSSRRVSVLATKGRIDGAIQVGSRWLIPENALKPLDGRTKISKNTTATQKDNFNFTAFSIIDCDDTNKYSNDEIQLNKVARAFFACDFDKANALLSTLPDTAENFYVRTISNLFGCLISLLSSNTIDFFKYYSHYSNILTSDIPYKKELTYLLDELDLTIGNSDNLYDKITIDPSYKYHPSFLPHYYSLLIVAIFFEKNIVSSHELNILEITSAWVSENPANSLDAQTIHIYLGLMHEILGNTAQKDFHLKKAFEIASKYDLYWLPAFEYYYYGPSFDKALIDCPKEVSEKIRCLSSIIEEKFLKLSNTTSSFFHRFMPRKKYLFFYYAFIGLTNKEIANIMHISEKSVKRNYAEIFQELGVESKKELVQYYHQVFEK